MEKPLILASVALMALTACQAEAPPTAELPTEEPTATPLPPTETPPPTSEPTQTSPPPTETLPPPPEPTGTILFIFGDEFAFSEYSPPREVLEDAGYRALVASDGLETLISHWPAEREVTPDMLLEDVVVADYDAIIFVGDNDLVVGHGRAESAHIAREALEQGRVVAAICSGVLVLGSTGVLDGVEMTADLATCENAETTFGGICTGGRVEQDGLIITASGPESSRGFAAAILETLQR
jgi:protease I